VNAGRSFGSFETQENACCSFGSSHSQVNAGRLLASDGSHGNAGRSLASIQSNERFVWTNTGRKDTRHFGDPSGFKFAYQENAGHSLDANGYPLDYVVGAGNKESASPEKAYLIRDDASTVVDEGLKSSAESCY
jgi:hypothetical protein